MKNRKNPQVREELLVLEKHFKQVILFLKKQKVRKMPVHIVMGNHHSGTTGLIRNCEISFSTVIPAIATYKKDLITKLSRDFSLNKPRDIASQQEYCRFWIADNGIFLDIPADFITHEQDQELWLALQTLIHKYRKALPIHSICYVLSLPDLLQEPEKQNQWLQHHRRALISLSKVLKQSLPLYILVTKCDLLHGFTTYFDNLRADERTQCFGINFNSTDKDAPEANVNSNTLTDKFNHQFDDLLAQLQAHVITRIHHERNSTKRGIIKEFPLQFETLQHALANFIAELVEKTKYCEASIPQGLYFVSAMQLHEKHIDILQNNLSQAFEFQTQAHASSLAHHSRAYFVHTIFADLLNNAVELKNQGKENARKFKLSTFNRKKLSYISAGVSLLVILSISAVWQYQNDKELLIATQNSLKKYQQNLSHNTSSNLATAVENIAAIGETKQLASRLSYSWLMVLNYYSIYELNSKTNVIYQSALQKILLPQLANQLEAELIDGAASPSELYTALKAYLMLGNTSNRQVTFLLHLADNLIKDQFYQNPKLHDQFIQILKDALEKDNTTISLNQKAIDQARATLSALPVAQLDYLILTNHANDKITSVNKDDDNSLVPYLYTSSGFKNVFIPELFSLLKQHNADAWVLGNNNEALSQIAQNKSAILTLYFQDYLNWWALYQSQKIFVNFTSFNQALSQLNDFKKNDAFANAIKTYLDNTSVDTLTTGIDASIIDNVSQTITNVFAPQIANNRNMLTTILNNSDIVKSINTELQQLQEYISTIQNAEDPAKIAFQFATLHASSKQNHDPINLLLNTANIASDPLKSWLNSLAENTWGNMLDLTKNYLNEQWHNQIVKTYNQTILNRYPIFNNANNDIALNDFSNFFGPQGILDNFYHQYLVAFVDTQSAQWQWRVIDNKFLPADASIPQMFERARIIRQMFYPNNNANLQVQFSLAPTQFEPIVTRIQININGQLMVSTQTVKTETLFNWPGSNINTQASLTLENLNQQQFSDKRDGAWAVFRLINDAQLQATRNPKVYNVIFTIDGNAAAQYQLTANNVINPFIPNIVDQFRCPETM